MHRALERLDGALSNVVPLLYLGGLALGTMAYFVGVVPDAGIAVGVGLAAAAECHSWLQQRRVRSVWAVLSRTPEGDARREQMVGQLRVNVALLVALIAFSAFNACAFAAATWHPAAGFLPAGVQVAIRGLVVPALFLASGFLTPLEADAGALLASASHDMLHRTINATTRQWRQRVDRAARRGHNLAPVAIALMEDAGDLDGARRIALIAAGLDAAEGRTPAGLQVAEIHEDADDAGAVFEASDTPPDRPPTGPGTPRRGRASKGRRGRRGQADVLRLVPEVAALPAEGRVRAILRAEPGLSVSEVSRRAHISLATASKWVNVIAAEQAERPQDGQAAL